MRSPFSVESARLRAGGILALLFLGQLCAQTLPPQARYSTHDWTVPWLMGAGGVDFREAFADVKSPGDGRTYSVGTVEVKDTGFTVFPAFFSGSPCDPSFPLAPFDNLSSGRQIVILQATDSTSLFPPTPTHPIVWQHYFYGNLGLGGLTSNPSNARGISVWPGGTVLDTRIAICGETYDQQLPLCSYPPPGYWNNVTPVPGGFYYHAGGFIAVYDGLGNLLWSHHFFTNRGPGGAIATNGHCAITDVSIRTDGAGNDVVTYCGISSFGNVAGPVDPLTPKADFSPPLIQAPCQTPTGGAVDNGGNQWDGIVGRLSRPHNGTGTTTTVFHSIVGGNEQDGLFGIAEIDADVFVVVGSSGSPGAVVGPNTFPFTTPVCPAANSAHGVAVVFNAGTIGPVTGALELRVAQHLSSQLGGSTVARDVYAVPRWSVVLPGLLDQILIVGSTTDANLLSQLGVVFSGPQAMIGGQADGFILGALPMPPSGSGLPWNMSFFSGTFRGGPANEGLTGIQGWNEFLDHFVVVGFGSLDFSTPPDIEVGSYYIDTSTTAPSPFQFKRLKQTRLGGTGAERPAAMGATTASISSGLPQLIALPFDEYTLGDPAGGGVAVDQMARVNVGGTTQSFDYPVSVNPLGRSRAVFTPAPTFSRNDAVRTVVDLLPAEVRRTDGTGDQFSGTAQYPLPGFFGGTTPECVLSPFGRRIGDPDPALPRMLIDCEERQPPLPGGIVELLVIRPPDGAGVVASAWQFDVLGTTLFPFTMVPEGVLLWTTNNPVTSWQAGAPGRTLRFPVGALPASPGIITAQLFCVLTTPVSGGVGPVCTGQSFFAASPALWFTY